MTDSDLTSARPRHRLEYATALVAIYVLATVLLFVPTYLLAVGIQAVGDRAGWWLGDPNSDDGEETFATGLGALGTAVIVVASGITAWAVGKRYRFQTAVANASALSAIGLGYISFWVWGFLLT